MSSNITVTINKIKGQVDKVQAGNITMGTRGAIMTLSVKINTTKDFFINDFIGYLKLPGFNFQLCDKITFTNMPVPAGQTTSTTFPIYFRVVKFGTFGNTNKILLSSGANGATYVGVNVFPIITEPYIKRLPIVMASGEWATMDTILTGNYLLNGKRYNFPTVYFTMPLFHYTTDIGYKLL